MPDPTLSSASERSRQDDPSVWSYEEALEHARRAIYDDGRGMIGANRNYLAYRVARALQEAQRASLRARAQG